MDKLGWWLGNNNSNQRRAINEAADELAAMSERQFAESNAVERLFALDRVQAHEMAQLRATIDALMGLLVESGAVEEKVLRYRIEAALADVEPDPALARPRPAPTAFETLGRGGAAGGPPPADLAAPTAPAPAPAPDPLVECPSCFGKVPRSRTSITERGTLCDRCAATGGG